MVRHKKSRMLRRFIFPASGLKSDVEDLLHKFVETESLRYEEFSKLWRAANFSLVHAGRAGLREKREFMDEAFKIVLKFTLPPHNLQVRVGAVYTLYALYHTQRQQPKTKVRMPIASWKDLLSLHHELAAQKHYDADYVMRSIMTKDRIFEFVAYPSPLSIEDHYNQDSDEEAVVDTSVSNPAEFTLIPRLLDEDSLGQLTAVHQKYHQLKCQLNAQRGGDGDKPSSSLDLIQSDVVDTIVELSQLKYVSPTPEPSENTISAEASERSRRIKEIKKRALSSRANTDSGVLRYLNTSPESSTKPVAKSRQRGRPIAKIIISAESSDEAEIAEDLISSTEVAPPRKQSKRKSRKRYSVTSPPDDEDDDNDDEDDDEDYDVQKDFKELIKKKRTMERNRRQPVRYSDLGNEPQPSKQSDPANRNVRHTSRSPSKLSKAGEPSSPKVVVKQEMSRDEAKSTKQTSNIQVKPNDFVALKPTPADLERPLLAKVSTCRGSEMGVVKYVGEYRSRWKAGKEAKINQSMVLMGSISLNAGRKLPIATVKQLRKLYAEIDANE